MAPEVLRGFHRGVRRSILDSVNDKSELRTIFERELSGSKFPTEECTYAGIDGVAHGEVILYLSDIAGLASRGQSLLRVVEPERSRFREIASRNLYERCPQLLGKIGAETTPSLYRLVAATERAREIILKTLS